VGEAAHVARGAELDGCRSSALGHEPLEGRVDGAVVGRDSGALGSKARVCVILLRCALTEDS
jgi:hypothetical protein